MACMSLFALAAPEDALLFTDTKDPSVITVMPVDDTLYILARQQNADTQLYEEVLYAYTLGASAAPELVCDDFCYTRHYLTLAQVPAEDSARYADGFGYLFSDGENLYGFNNLTGSMARLTFSQGVMNREEVCTVDLDALRVKGVDYEYLMDLNTTVCANGYIAFVFTDWRMEVPASTLYSISLADGSVEKHPLAQPVMYLADAGEDVLLGITYPAAETLPPAKRHRRGSYPYGAPTAPSPGSGIGRRTRSPPRSPITGQQIRSTMPRPAPCGPCQPWASRKRLRIPP